MEDTLRGDKKQDGPKEEKSLNPCFNGRYSQRFGSKIQNLLKVGLNPCFDGRYSQRFGSKIQNLLKVGLNPCFDGRYSQSYKDTIVDALNSKVLILVLMEDTLRA